MFPLLEVVVHFKGVVAARGVANWEDERENAITWDCTSDQNAAHRDMIKYALVNVLFANSEEWEEITAFHTLWLEIKEQTAGDTYNRLYPH